jgi:predicted DNA-binding antitoxin AbrB/MazE fold protein
MPRSLQVIYENGVLRPLEPVVLKEHQQLTVIVSEAATEGWLDESFLRYLEAQADDSATLEEVRSAMAKIPGSMVDDFRRERHDRI